MTYGTVCIEYSLYIYFVTSVSVFVAGRWQDFEWPNSRIWS